jgi:hypothetical protein
MVIRADLLLTHEFPDARQSYTKRDAILYALGAGLGADPTDPADLPFLLEDRLKVLPTYAVTLGSPGVWIRAPRQPPFTRPSLRRPKLSRARGSLQSPIEDRAGERSL